MYLDFLGEQTAASNNITDPPTIVGSALPLKGQSQIYKHNISSRPKTLPKSSVFSLYFFQGVGNVSCI